MTAARDPLTIRGMEVSRRERAPWLPERGQRVRVIGTVSVPEWAAFSVAMVVAVLLLVAGIVLL